MDSLFFEVRRRQPVPCLGVCAHSTDLPRAFTHSRGSRVTTEPTGTGVVESTAILSVRSSATPASGRRVAVGLVSRTLAPSAQAQARSTSPAVAVRPMPLYMVLPRCFARGLRTHCERAGKRSGGESVDEAGSANCW